MSSTRIWIRTLVMAPLLVWMPDAAAADVSCLSYHGNCSVGNAPIDLILCQCDHAPPVLASGGNAWAGLDEAELEEICDVVLDEACPPAGVDCSDIFAGDCSISFDENDEPWVSCHCGSGPGDPDWADIPTHELEAVCAEIFQTDCAGLDTGGTGTNGGTDATDGTRGSETGTGSSTGDVTGSDGDGSSGGSESTAVADPSVGASTVTDPTVAESASASDGEGDGDGGSSGGDGGATGDGSGCSCATSGSPVSGGWGLAVAGLVGWRVRRGRARPGD